MAIPISSPASRTAGCASSPTSATITIGFGTLSTSPEVAGTSVTEKIGPVLFTGTVLTNNIRATTPNTIALGGTVSCAAGGGIRARISADSPSGQITFDGATRLFNVPDATSRLEIQGNLADGGAAGGFTKQGAGDMILAAPTTFTGPVTVTAGRLTLADNQALGGTAGATAVQAEGTLVLGLNVTGVSLPAAETIHLAGTVTAFKPSTIAGPLVLSGTPTLSADSGDSLTHTGVISGSGAPLNIGGLGTVIMAGTASNTMSGTVSVSAGS